MITFKRFFKESVNNAEYRFSDIYHEELTNIISEFRSRRPNTNQGWSVVPANRLIKIWNDYAKTGIIRDERGMDEIADRMVRNVVRLGINTALLGHTQLDPSELFDEYSDDGLTEEEKEALGDFIVDDNGSWRLSDYGLPKLENLVFTLLNANTYPEKLLIVDQMLNITHQRSDLAGMFVEGGTSTLNKLAS
jgi:hypothetical protein